MVIRVVLADDHAVVRKGVREFLEDEPDIEVVGEAGDGQEALDMAAKCRPHVVLMDIRMPGMDGLEATRWLTAGAPHDPVKVLILTTFDIDEYVVEALRAGASGFMLKDAPADSLIEGIKVVAVGDALLAPSITRRLLDRFVDSLSAPEARRSDIIGALTEREVEVLKLVARGLSNAEIAEKLFIGVKTVDTHRSNLYQKFGVHSLGELLMTTARRNLIEF